MRTSIDKNKKRLILVNDDTYTLDEIAQVFSCLKPLSKLRVKSIEVTEDTIEIYCNIENLVYNLQILINTYKDNIFRLRIYKEKNSAIITLTAKSSFNLF